MNFSVIPASWKVIAAIILAGALSASHIWSVHKADRAGYARATLERSNADAEHLRADTAKADKETKERQAKADSDAIARQQEKTKYEATINDLRVAARAGNSGLRVNAACVPAITTPASTSAASRPGAEEGYDLVPSVAESVLSAAADLRQSVSDRNALIDRFNECRSAANAP